MKKILVSLVLGLVGLFAFAGSAYGATSVVYNALPEPLPPNAPSEAFQATQTSEFGDYVHLGGTDRNLTTITVAMSDWALYADYAGDSRYSADSANWTHPITLNVYSVVSGTPNTAGTLLGSVTQTITIPWRPAEDPINCPTKSDPGYAYKWQAIPGPADTNCYNGFAFNAVFDLSGLGIVLPDDVIVSLAFSTQSYGTVPIGLNGPYNSLNVLVPESQPVTIGTDDSSDKVFQNTGIASTFQEYTGWTPYGTVAMKIEAEKILLGEATGGLRLSGPRQQISFDAYDYGDSSLDEGVVEYQNFEYPGGLHYTANILCANVDKESHQAWFVFQIPPGFNISGIYVLAHVFDGGTPGTKGDGYSHTGAPDLSTALSWCEAGSVNGTTYPITAGNLVVHQ